MKTGARDIPNQLTLEISRTSFTANSLTNCTYNERRVPAGGRYLPKTRGISRLNPISRAELGLEALVGVH